MSYFSIHNHSDYSNASLGFADSINNIEKSLRYAIDIGLKGYVLSDHEILAGGATLIRCREKFQKEGLIDDSFTIGLGNEIYLLEDNKEATKFYHHLLIAKDEVGHKILRRASSKAWENSFVSGGITRTPIYRSELKKIIEEEGKGHVISSTACLGSYESQKFLEIMKEESKLNPNVDVINSYKQQIVDFVEWNKDVFGQDFYLEIAPNSSQEQRYVNKRTWALGKFTDTKVVFSTDSHYLSEEDREIHKAYLNSKQAEREVDEFYYTAYMMEENKVKEYFLLDFSESEYKEMLANLEELRSKITHYTLFKEQEIPLVSVTPPELDSSLKEYDLSPYLNIQKLLLSEEAQNQYWIKSCLNQMVKENLMNKEYLNQIDIEANTLIKISERLKQPMTAYYNTAQKIIQLIWEEGDSLVGVSRGSAMGFLSNYLLGITQIDPLPYLGDVSWRHLSESRPELPEL